MTVSIPTVILEELDRRIQSYDLLTHPFYKAWDAGCLTREDLREYAADYFAHVAAFPSYLSTTHSRMDDGELRRELLRNLCGEEIQGKPHSELWLDFAEAMGADRAEVRHHEPLPEIRDLLACFREIATSASPAAAFAAFYAYESQVPRIAAVKARGLRDAYGVNESGVRYFTLHETADVHHSRTWRRSLEVMLEAEPELADAVLAAGESAAKALWRALDGVERERQGRLAAA